MHLLGAKGGQRNNYDIAKLPTPRTDSVWQRDGLRDLAMRLERENAAMRQKLEWIADRYDDNKPAVQCAMDAYDMKCVAAATLASIREYEEQP